MAVLCSAFSRDVNDAVWAEHRDFELPLSFGLQEAHAKNACEGAKIEGDPEDEDYKFFLENIRLDGRLCAFELKKKQDGHVVFIRFEEVEDRHILHQCWNENLKFGLRREDQENMSKCRGTRTIEKMIPDVDHRHTLPLKKCKLEDSALSEKEETRKRMKVMGSGGGSDLLTDSKTTKMRITENIPRTMIEQRKPDMQCCNRKIVKSEDSSLPITSPSHVPTTENVESRRIPSCIHSADFRKNLEATLKEPFNTQQLHEMWNAVNCRKPIVQLRQTRHRTVQVATNQEGSSYLDYHPDLAERLALATSPEEKLSLLRGFFFWLKYSSWSDAFQPWVSSCTRKSSANVNDDDDDCVEVDRPDCEVIAVVLSVDERETVTSLFRHGPSMLLPEVEAIEEKPKIQGK
eukprot:Gb_09648 [translate_table: standard]